MEFRRKINDRMISMPGILMILFGGCFLFVYNKFQAVQVSISFSTASSLKSLSIILICLGVWLVLSNYFKLPRIPGFRKKNQPKRTVSFPRQGLIYLVILQVVVVGALMGRVNLLLLIFSLMAAVFVVNGGSIHTMLQKLEVKRNLPHSISVGQVFSVQITLINHKKLVSSRMMEVIDTFSDGKKNVKAETVFAYVAPGATEYASYQLKLSRRGKYQFGTMKVTSRFPIGIVERGIVFDKPAELLVFPRIGKLSLSWKNILQDNKEVLQVRNLKKGLNEDEFHRIREYRYGDNPRSIHWTSTAKHAELMVWEFHENRESNIDLILDLWSPLKPSLDDELRVELAISFVATILCEQNNDSHDNQLKIAVLGEENYVWEGYLSHSNLREVLSHLADVTAYSSNKKEICTSSNHSKYAFDDQVLLVTTRKSGTSEWDDILNNINSNWLLNQNTQLLTVEADPEVIQKYYSLPPL